MKEKRLDTPTTKNLRANRTKARKREFLKGPISWRWLRTASVLPGKSLHVALALWHLSGLRSSKTVKLSRDVLLGLGVAPDAAARGLLRLEGVGLVKVARHRGRLPVVTLVTRKSTKKGGK